METGENNTNQEPAATPQATQPVAPSSDNTTLMGVLAYIGILVLIPLLTAKDNAFVKFHVKQGLVLLVLEVIVMVLGSMMWSLYAILNLVNLGLFVLSILGIINVVQRKEAEVPLIGQFAKHFNI